MILGLYSHHDSSKGNPIPMMWMLPVGAGNGGRVRSRSAEWRARGSRSDGLRGGFAGARRVATRTRAGWLRSGTVARRCLLAAATVLVPGALAGAAELPASPGESVVGNVTVHEARFEDSLLDIARRYGMGIEELRLANPGVDFWLPGEGTPVQLPSRFVLPTTSRRGVVINVPEMRLYHFPSDGTKVRTWPISIGRLGYETPLGRTSVVRKKTGPTWYPTESIREEHAARGDILPLRVAPGPDNPLGTHAIYLGFPTYLIHGTNRPYSIGMRVSHGCVRMYPEHIVELYDLVDAGTPVTIVHQRVKAGWSGGEFFLEVHPNADVPEEDAIPSMTEAVRSIIRATPEGGQRPAIDWSRVEKALSAANGIPVAVGRREPGSDLAREGRARRMAAAAPSSS